MQGKRETNNCSQQFSEKLESSNNFFQNSYLIKK